MAEKNDKNTSKTTASPDPPPAKPAPSLPVDMFVKGATTTWEHDKKVKRDFLEAEKRRDIADTERRFAEGAAGGVGNLYTHRMTDSAEAGLPEGKVELSFVNSKGEQEYEGGEPLKAVGDICVPENPAYDGELMLIIFCPQCIRRLPAGESIIQIRQSNRKWYLDARTAGEMFLWKDIQNDGTVQVEAYRSAGIIMDCEKFTCARCDWKAAIHKNKIWTIR